MNKQEILSGYKDQNEKFLISFILDKIKFVETRNKIENTNFLDMYQLELVETFLKKTNNSNYLFWGGFEQAERKSLILYPTKMNVTMISKNYSKIMEVIRIDLPEKDQGKYFHRNYLSAIMKLGIEREKIGDILVENSGADIIVLNEVGDFLTRELPMLKRFEDSKIYIKSIENLNQIEVKTKDFKIIVPSLRLDNFVSDLAKTSRTKALDIIKNERVFVNGKLETKISKSINIEDTITIRGKGRFVVKELTGTTRSGRSIVMIRKFI